MYQVQLRIGDADRPGADGTQTEKRNPISGEIATQSACATAQDIDAAAQAAHKAFQSWRQTGPNERRHILLEAADIMTGKAGEFAEIVMTETGATKMWGGFNAKLAAEIVREAGAMTTRILGEVIPADRNGTTAFAMRKPVGVMVGIAPWNAPVILGARAVAMPIACGNTVILKASENCPMTHRLIVDCLLEAGLPEGVCNFITNHPDDAPEIVEALVTHPLVKRINFTGSTKIGKVIAALAARDLKPALLELGGKAPLVILDDADMEEAVKASVFGAFMHQGQICMSTERIIIAESIAKDFVKRLAEKTAGLQTGDPTKNGVHIGGVIDEKTVAHINALVADAEQKGADIVVKGKADGTIMSPTLVAGVTPDMRIWSEESFGPVVGIAYAKDDDHAIALANDTEYGLSAAVFSQNINRAMRVAENIESGICHINGATVFDEAQMPFGGTKSSGYGRFGGSFGINEFTETQWLTINAEPLHYPI